VMRQIPAGDVLVRSGQWPHGNLALTTRFFGKKVGIAGIGRIGQAVAKRAAAFDCAIGYFARHQHADLPYAYMADLVDLATWSDILIVTLAGGPSTKGIVSAEVLEALGPDGYLINISRGSTVDETALLAALQSRSIKGAGLDVFLNEPGIDPCFLALDNAVLHPHHGSGTVETRRAMGQLVRDNLAAHFAGQPLLTPVA
jgi:lactate dehydrogenase-like 2-hydroxyacid dehydrogenase